MLSYETHGFVNGLKRGKPKWGEGLRIRKRYAAQFKSAVALEALKGKRTIKENTLQFKVHPVQVSQWKRILQKAIPEVFSSDSKGKQTSAETLVVELYEEIGRFKIELEWLKKKPISTEMKCAMIEEKFDLISIRRQSELIALNRSTVYYEPAPVVRQHSLISEGLLKSSILIRT